MVGYGKIFIDLLLANKFVEADSYFSENENRIMQECFDKETVITLLKIFITETVAPQIFEFLLPLFKEQSYNSNEFSIPSICCNSQDAATAVTISNKPQSIFMKSVDHLSELENSPTSTINRGYIVKIVTSFIETCLNQKAAYFSEEEFSNINLQQESFYSVSPRFKIFEMLADQCYEIVDFILQNSNRIMESLATQKLPSCVKAGILLLINLAYKNFNRFIKKELNTLSSNNQENCYKASLAEHLFRVKNLSDITDCDLTSRVLYYSGDQICQCFLFEYMLRISELFTLISENHKTNSICKEMWPHVLGVLEITTEQFYEVEPGLKSSTKFAKEKASILSTTEAELSNLLSSISKKNFITDIGKTVLLYNAILKSYQDFIYGFAKSSNTKQSQKSKKDKKNANNNSTDSNVSNRIIVSVLKLDALCCVDYCSYKGNKDSLNNTVIKELTTHSLQPSQYVGNFIDVSDSTINFCLDSLTFMARISWKNSNDVTFIKEGIVRIPYLGISDFYEHGSENVVSLKLVKSMFPVKSPCRNSSVLHSASDSLLIILKFSSTSSYKTCKSMLRLHKPAFMRIQTSFSPAPSNSNNDSGQNCNIECTPINTEPLNFADFESEIAANNNIHDNCDLNIMDLNENIEPVQFTVSELPITNIQEEHEKLEKLAKENFKELSYIGEVTNTTGNASTDSSQEILNNNNNKKIRSLIESIGGESIAGDEALSSALKVIESVLRKKNMEKKSVLVHANMQKIIAMKRELLERQASERKSFNEKLQIELKSYHHTVSENKKKFALFKQQVAQEYEIYRRLIEKTRQNGMEISNRLKTEADLLSKHHSNEIARLGLEIAELQTETSRKITEFDFDHCLITKGLTRGILPVAAP